MSKKTKQTDAIANIQETIDITKQQVRYVKNELSNLQEKTGTLLKEQEKLKGYITLGHKILNTLKTRLEAAKNKTITTKPNDKKHHNTSKSTPTRRHRTLRKM